MTEADGVPDGDELPGLGRGGRRQGEAQLLAGLGQQAGIAGGVRGRRQQQGLRGGGQFPDLAQVTLFEPAAERQWFGQERVAVQFAAGQFLANLDERQRVAARLRDDPVRDRGAQPRPGRRREHGAGVVGGQPGQAEFWQPAQAAREPRGLADGEDDGDRVGVQPPGHERERVSGFLIQAVCVVDQAQQRLAGGLPGEQPQRGQPGEKAVRRAAFRHAERHPQRGALRRGQPV